MPRKKNRRPLRDGLSKAEQADRAIDKGMDIAREREKILKDPWYADHGHSQAAIETLRRKKAIRSLLRF